MSMVIQVGDVDQMPKSPKRFPRCGDWTLDSDDDDDELDKLATSCPPLPVSASKAPSTKPEEILTTMATSTVGPTTTLAVIVLYVHANLVS